MFVDVISFLKVAKMVRGKPICGEIRQMALKYIQEGCSQRETARRCNLERSSVQSIIKNYEASRSLENKPKTGRPCTVSRRERHLLRDIIRQNRRKSTKEVAELWGRSIERKVSSSLTLKNVHLLWYGFYKVCIFAFHSVENYFRFICILNRQKISRF